jgi:hypothetical protein
MICITIAAKKKKAKMDPKSGTTNVHVEVEFE